MEAPDKHPIDPLSEMLALSTYGNKKNLLISIVELQGPLDRQKLEEAFHQAKISFPEFDSSLKEVKQRGRYYLYRHWRPDLTNELNSLDIEILDGETVIDASLRALSHRLDRDWDLFNEPLGEAHLARVSKEHHLLISIIHHAAADAATTANFGFDTARKYCEAIGLGNWRDWSNGESVTTAKKRAIKAKKRTFRDALLEAKDAFLPFFQRSRLPEGSGDKEDTGQFHVKRRLNDEEVQSFMGAKRVALVDQLVCASHLAIDQWNTERGRKPGALRTSITVNMKGRFTWFDKPNNSGLIEFTSNPEDRVDQERLTKAITRSRIRQFRKQLDLRFFINVARMNDTFRILPFRLRRKLVHFIMERRRYSVGVTVLGVLNPELKNGRPTGDSITASCGDVEITEIHGLGYKLLSSTRLVIIAYRYGEFLNIIMATSACHFTREEAEDFLDLVIANLSHGGTQKYCPDSGSD